MACSHETCAGFDCHQNGTEARSRQSSRRHPRSAVGAPSDRVELRVCPLRRRGNSPQAPQKIAHEDDNPDGQTRRRVPVACARCRRRKIRCSGDPGDGTGCQNCRAAGADIKECIFNRVGASEVPLVRLGLHPDGFISTPNLAGGDDLPAYSPALRSYSMSQYGSGASRLSIGGFLPSNDAVEGQTDAYGAQSNTQVMSHRQFTAACGYAPSFGQLTAMPESRGTATSIGGYYADQDLLGHTVGPHQQSSVSTAPVRTASENLSPFGMTSLSRSLLHPQNDRQLPPVTISHSGRHVQVPTANEMKRARIVSQFQLANGDVNLHYLKQTLPVYDQAAIGRSSYYAGSADTLETPYSRLKPTIKLEGDTMLSRLSMSDGSDLSSIAAPPLGYASSTMSAQEAAHAAPALHGMPIQSAGSLNRADSSASLYTLSSTAAAQRDASDISSSEHSSIASGQQYTPMSHPRPLHVAGLGGFCRDPMAMTPQQSSSSAGVDTTRAGFS